MVKIEMAKNAENGKKKKTYKREFKSAVLPYFQYWRGFQPYLTPTDPYRPPFAML